MCLIILARKKDNEVMNFVTLLMVEIHTFHVQDMPIWHDNLTPLLTSSISVLVVYLSLPLNIYYPKMDALILTIFSSTSIEEDAQSSTQAHKRGNAGWYKIWTHIWDTHFL